MELSIFRGALRKAQSATQVQELAAALGFEVEDHLVNYLDDPSSKLHERVHPVADGLYRVGSYPSTTGPVGFWTADLRDWEERSAQRERARRRITKALVELQPAGDRRFLLGLTKADVEDIELVLPRVRADKSFGTIRAVINREEPTHHQLQLLRDSALEPGMTAVAAFRRWSDAFSVERVAKRFYTEFKALHQSVMDELKRTNPTVSLIQDVGNEAEIRRFVTRNLGRLLFLWFLQSKGWLDGDRRYLINLYERRCRSNEAHNFFRDTLIPLFFEALARKEEERSEAARVLGDVPYLNGGLFIQSRFEDQLYGERRENLQITLPNSLFDPRQHTADSPTVLGLLRSYRFTTRESTPDDQSVDPDPELLGKVFENLNEEAERAQTGTFYTPREVVQFMCREALDGYLEDHTSFQKEDFDWLRAKALDPTADERHLSIEERQEIHRALSEVTICDPAVGSGAFPVGMMQEILLLKRGLEQSTDVTVDIGGQKMAEWKEHIITHCLYGVDINPEAVEICHLRLWLSMVIDANDPIPLPNLDFRFEAGDSLVDRVGTERLSESLPRREFEMQLGLGPWEEVMELEKEIRKMREEFVLTSAPARARELRVQVKEKQARAVRIQIDIGIEGLQERLRGARRRLEELQEHGAARRTINRQEKAVEQLEEKIAQLEQLKEGLDPWAPYKKPFLWPVEFPEVFEKGGFDIVVANPPYVRQESLSPEDQETYEASFPEVYKGTADLLLFFYARAVQILKDEGCLSFIISNKFMRAGYGDGIREFLPSNLKIRYLIDFGDLQVFDAASYPAVLIGKKRSTSKDHFCHVTDLSHIIRKRILDREAPVNVANVRAELEDLPSLLEEAGIKGFPQVLLRRRGWVLEDPKLIRLFDRLMEQGTPLGEFVEGRMYRGVLTGLNEAFVIDEQKREELIEADPKSKEIIKPWLRGRDIKRWRAEPSGLYLIAIQNSGDETACNPWGSCESEEEARTVFAETYPAIHEHLSQYEERLRPRADQGKFWWELRACTYYREFEEPKIIWRDVALRPTFALDEKGKYGDTTVFMMGSTEEWLLAVLNSMLATTLFSLLTPSVRGGYLRFKTSYIEPLSIIVPSSSDRVEIATLARKALDNKDDCNLIEQEIDECVLDIYRLNAEERDLLKAWYTKRALSMEARDEGPDNAKG